MKRAAPTTSLQPYRRKRDFARTPEPAGRTQVRPAVGQPIFVVQKHAAARLHYDFRLELDGTLKSWAVPKGPSLDPGQKRLAVHVEDHPLDYARFEGIIPPKQYGAGTVLIWDRGIWHPQGSSQDSYRKGVLKFRLEGQKLRGAWTLVRMHRRSEGEDKDNWLLIKERDAEARTGPAGEIVNRLTDSVESGRGLEEVAQQSPRVWQSNRAPSRSSELGVMNSELSGTKISRSANSELSTQHSKRRPSASRSSSRNSELITQNSELSSVPGARKAKHPDWIPPQLATLVAGMPAGDEWIHEIKLDGYRILCQVHHGEVRLFTRKANDWTAKLGAQADAVASLGLADAWLDGEVVVFTEEGRTDFQALQNAFDSQFTGQIVYCLFDLLYLNGYDLRGSVLIERKRLLASLLADRTTALLRYSDHIAGQGSAAFDEACRRGLEGLIAKRGDSIYSSGRSRSWLKVKCEQRQEFVIGGFTDPAGSRQGFGALLVGFYEGNTLRYAGKVGTGFTETSLRQLHRKLSAIEQPRPPFANPPTGYEAKGAHWVKPDLVAEVRFAEWTNEDVLRQASFQGLRADKSPRTIVREHPQGNPGSADHAATDVRQAPTRKKKAQNKKRDAVRSSVRLTNPQRVLYPDLGLTKEGLARYYEQVVEWILPHLRGRPLTLVRCPHGYQDCFYQKHVNETVPKAIGRVEIAEDDSQSTYMVADSLDAVLGLVQMGVLELHTWGATRDRLERPDRLTFDLDPDPSVSWAQVIEAAQLTRTLLDELGLVSFVKTTGGKGLHVVVPIQRTLDWDQAKGFSKAVADHLVRTIPQRFTANMAKRARKGKIFIDYLRNARGATAIAAYSTRARPGAPVSVPLAWEELSSKLTSDHFTVATLPDRLKDLAKDPWVDYERIKQRLTDQMAARLRAK